MLYMNISLKIADVHRPSSRILTTQLIDVDFEENGAVKEASLSEKDIPICA